MNSLLPKLNVVRLNRFDIFQQLRYEEILLRHHNLNWCILNAGTIKPVVVTGLGGVIPELVNTSALRR
jgi:hypothetical protein